jgi:hypothetical protein
MLFKPNSKKARDVFIEKQILKHYSMIITNIHRNKNLSKLFKSMFNDLFV